MPAKIKQPINPAIWINFLLFTFPTDSCSIFPCIKVLIKWLGFLGIRNLLAKTFAVPIGIMPITILLLFIPLKTSLIVSSPPCY